MSLKADGAVLASRVLDPYPLRALEASLADLPSRPGLRLNGRLALYDLLTQDGIIGQLAAGAIGPDARPVRAVLFDKTAEANWRLGWHQDRTIAVVRKQEIEGFGPWSVKAGLVHVEPPFAFLERMVTLRVHLDPVGPDNAPLLIAPGSHRLGRIPVNQIEDVVAASGAQACLADAGDVWIYSTPIIHASDVAVRPWRRRVLQVDYSAEALPGGLEWLGV